MIVWSILNSHEYARILHNEAVPLCVRNIVIGKVFQLGYLHYQLAHIQFHFKVPHPVQKILIITLLPWCKSAVQFQSHEVANE